MTGSQVTGLLLASALAAAGVWDVYAATRWGVDATLSRLAMALSVRFPVIPLLVGVLLGHLFWPQIPPAVEDGPHAPPRVTLPRGRAD